MPTIKLSHNPNQLAFLKPPVLILSVAEVGVEWVYGWVDRHLFDYTGYIRERNLDYQNFISLFIFFSIP